MKKKRFKKHLSDEDFNCFLDHALSILYSRRAELNRIIYYLEHWRGDGALKYELKQR